LQPIAGEPKISKGAQIKAESADRAATLAPEKAAKKRAAMVADKSGKTKRSNPQLYLNRELAQLEFNRRVLAQAEDADVPLLERLRFLCIVSNNLDEFFEIRVAGLKAQIELGADTTGPDGATPSQTFKEVSSRTHQLVARQYQLLNETILPELERAGILETRRGVGTFVNATPAQAHPPKQRERRLHAYVTRVLADAAEAGFTVDNLFEAIQSHRKGDA